jgi:hypothetical protein
LWGIGLYGRFNDQGSSALRNRFFAESMTVETMSFQTEEESAINCLPRIVSDVAQGDGRARVIL